MIVTNNHQLCILQNYKPHSPQISFESWTREQAHKFHTDNGLPENLHAAYSGYAGPKEYNFLTSPDLSIDKYPDITQDLIEFRDEVIGEIRETQKKNGKLGFVNIIKLLGEKFPTGEPFDTKYLPKFPGRDKDGNTQYAVYKGKVVSANYISNNFYAQITASIGLPRVLSRIAAKMDACGLAEVIFKHKIPPKELRKFRDTPEDQDAIVSGYADYRMGNPWINPEIDPKRPYPKQLDHNLDLSA